MQKAIAVEGFDQIVDHNSRILSGERWIDRLSWRRYFRQAWQVKMRANNFVRWQTAPLPALPDAADAVVCVWAMGLGSFSRSTQPTGEFVITVNGRKALSFCESSSSRCWRRGSFSFYFEVKRRGDCV